MGLLQEGILTNRIAEAVRGRLSPAQSGYTRGCEDPQLLMHELCAWSLAQLLCMWCLLRDFEKAFPKVWRDDLAVLLGSGGGMKYTALAMAGALKAPQDRSNRGAEEGREF